MRTTRLTTMTEFECDRAGCKKHVNHEGDTGDHRELPPGWVRFGGKTFHNEMHLLEALCELINVELGSETSLLTLHLHGGNYEGITPTRLDTGWISAR